MNLSKFKAWTHWLAGILTVAWGVYATNDAVHQAVNNAVSHNKKIAAFLAIVTPIVTAYLNSEKKP